MTEAESLRAINKSIQVMSGTFKADKVKFIWATVNSYDIDKQTCEVTGENDVVIADVALSAGVCDGFVIYPTKDSQVVIAETIYASDKTRWVTMFSDVDAIYMFTQNGWLSAWSNGEPGALQSKSFGGLAKVVDPVNQTAGLLAKINQLEKTVNNLITSFNSHLHISAAPTVNTSAPNVPFTGVIAPITQQSDIQNDLITHGKL